ncbi:MAG: 2OG-Fe(II) oxygenase family protein [Sphingobacteriales bacterium JAD_PAG50586_3]|nr:MAG: 2OG-Fe(II) oxygenase family protein [Sphingobacteriales bacterium JAD_PAG50586_3]
MYNDIERSLTRMLLEYFGQDSAPSFNCDRDSDMQVLFYQPELHNRELLQEPHDDSLYMTFAKATAPGLEILLSDGLFHKVELDRNEVLVMPGEILALMAGYRIKPLIHQVVRYSDQKSRFSLGYFTLPNIERGANISPWVSNNSNNHINIMDRVIHNQNQYLVADKSQPQEIKNLTISES